MDKISTPGKTPLRESIQRLIAFHEATGNAPKAQEFKQKLADFDRTQAAPNPAAPPGEGKAANAP